MPERRNEERVPSRLQLESVGMSLKPELESVLRDSGIDARVEYHVAGPTDVASSSLVFSVSVEVEDLVPITVKSVRKILVPHNLVRMEGSASQAFTMECPIPPGTWPSDWDKITFRDAVVVVSVFSGPYSADNREILQFPTKNVAVEETQMESTSATKNPISFRTLLLSGGGYRAAAYHIGVIRWLYEHRLPGESSPLLEAISDVVGISGGSIIAAHFVQNRPKYLSDFWGQAKILVDFLTSVNMRESVLLHGKSVAEVLMSPVLQDNKALFSENCGFEPRDSSVGLHILATDLSEGDTVAITQKGMFRVSTAGTLHDQKIQSGPCNVTFAISASAAFPPFIPSVQISKETLNLAIDASLGNLGGNWIADGGIRDNLGIEYVRKVTLRSTGGRFLASDAGALFDYSKSQFGPSVTGDCDNKIERLKYWMLRFTRAIDIQSKRIRDLDLVSLPAVDRVSLHEANNAHLRLSKKESELPFHLQPLNNEVAQRVAATSTDLSSLSRSHVFALARLAYDSCARKFSEDGFVKYENHVDTEFWEEMLSPTIESRPRISSELLSTIPVPVDFSAMIAANLDLLPRGGPEGRFVDLAIWLKNHWTLVRALIFVGVLSTAFGIYSILLRMWPSPPPPPPEPCPPCEEFFHCCNSVSGSVNGKTLQSLPHFLQDTLGYNNQSEIPKNDKKQMLTATNQIKEVYSNQYVKVLVAYDDQSKNKFEPSRDESYFGTVSGTASRVVKPGSEVIVTLKLPDTLPSNVNLTPSFDSVTRYPIPHREKSDMGCLIDGCDIEAKLSGDKVVYRIGVHSTASPGFIFFRPVVFEEATIKELNIVPEK